MISEKIIFQAANSLVEKFLPDRIILFGSYANGTAEERSDVDLLVITTFKGKRRKLIVEMDRALRGINIGLDIVILTPEEFARDREIPGTIARPASLEGKILYERT